MKLVIILTLLLNFANLDAANRAIDLYKELLKNTTNECVKTDHNANTIPNSETHCGATSDFSLLCLPSARIGETYTINCTQEIPQFNGSIDTLTGAIKRKCSTDGVWMSIDADGHNYCKFHTMDKLFQLYFTLDINPFEDFTESEYNELLDHLGKFEPAGIPKASYKAVVTITKKENERIKLLELILGSISCFFSILGLFILLWLYPRKKRERINVHIHLFGVLFVWYASDLIFTRYGIDRKISSWTSCHVTYFVYAYSTVMVFTWLFNEGLYHFWIIFYPYKDALKFRYLLLIGYGIPTLEMIVYIPGVLLHKKRYFRCMKDSGGVFSEITVWDQIVWYSSSLLLCLNILIFGYLMVILWRKLQREKGTNLRKRMRLIRSWFILLILLGGGTFFQIDSTIESKFVEIVYFQRAVMGLQGFLIFVSQVLLSGNVMKKVRNKWRIYRQKQEIGSPQISNRTASSSVKLSVKRFNNNNKGSYEVNSIKKKNNEPCISLENKKHHKSCDSISGLGADHNGTYKLNKQTITKQNSLGFDNVGYNKDQKV